MSEMPLTLPWITALPMTPIDERRAVRFGGFQAGGYSAECAPVAVLTLEENNGVLAAQWEIIQTQMPERWRGQEVGGDASEWVALMARAYHTATLLRNRYLLIVGGMKSTASILHPDTQTWTWIEIDFFGDRGHLPSVRHGHSTIQEHGGRKIALYSCLLFSL